MDVHFWKRVFVTCALFAETATAQNLVLNPDFDTDLSHWNPDSIANWSVDTSDGFPAAGSAHGVGNMEGISIRSDCIAISGGQDIDLIADVKDASQFASVSITIVTFANSTCSAQGGQLALGQFSQPLGNGWMQGGMTAPLPAGIGSVVLLLQTSGFGAIADTRWDHIRFGPSGTAPVRLQSFGVTRSGP